MSVPAWQRTIVNNMGDIQAGAEVEVIVESTGLPATIYSNRAGTTPLTNPFFADSGGFAQFYAAPDEYRITATSTAGVITWRYVVLEGTAATKDAQTSPTDATAGRLMQVGAGGLLSDSAIVSAATIDGSPETGFYQASSYTTIYDAATYNFINVKIDDNTGHQFAMRKSSVVLWEVRTKTSGTWSGWQEIYHSGNTNFNEFGCDGADSIISVAYAISPSGCRSTLPVSSYSEAVSVTVAGTFKLVDLDGTVMSTSIGSGNITLSKQTHKVAALLITGLSGLTSKETYYLQSESSSSKITVNF